MDPNDTEDLSELSDDELEARQRAEDGEDPNANPKVGEEDEAGKDDAAAADKAAGAKEDPAAKTDPDPKDDPAAADAATDKPAADKPAGGEPAKVEGVQSKDGTRVLPYAALQAERRSARAASSRAERAERELAAAQQQIADLKAGKAPASQITEADVADMEANFPEEGKKMRALFNRAQELEKQVPKAEPSKDEPTDDPVQDAIDQVPMLLEWQHGDPEKFERAQEIDAVLVKSPKWANKPAVDRFTEVARMVAEEHDIEFPQAQKPSTTATAKAAPVQTAAQQAQRKPPETLSDFKGGAIPDHGSIDASRASPRALLARMEDMTDDEIDAHLAKYG